MIWPNIVLLIAGAGLAAFFSGAETGAYVISRLRLRYRAGERGERWAQRLEKLLENTPIFVTAMLIWTNLALDLVSASCTSLYANSGIGLEPEIAATLTAAPILLIFAELAPKSLFRLRAEGLMASSSRALQATVYLVYPFARVLSATGQVIRRWLSLPAPIHWASVSRHAVHAHLAAGVAQGALSGPQQHLAENILRAGTMPAALAATPVEKEMVLSEQATAEDFTKRAGEIETPRALIYSGHQDRVVGVVHIVSAWAAAPETTLARLMRMPVWLDQGVSVLQALVALKRAGQSVAILAAPAPEGSQSKDLDDLGGITQTIDWRAKGTVTVAQLLKHLVTHVRRSSGRMSSAGRTTQFIALKT